MQVRALRRSPKALVATMLATVMIFGTTIAAMAGIQDSMPDYESKKEISGLINSEATYAPGTQVTLTANPDAVADAGISGTVDADYHFEWYLEDATTDATLNRKGVLTISSTAEEGSATIVALVVKGAKAENGGTGTGPWYPVLEDILGYSEAIFSVKGETAYGWQGTGGLQMQMTSPADITQSGSISNATGIINTIKNPVSITNGTATFQFKLDGGLNTESAFKDNGNVDRIHVYSYSRGSIGSEIENSVTYGGTDTDNATVTIDASGLTSGNQYVIEFDSDIQGNNSKKILGTNIYFIFRAQ